MKFLASTLICIPWALVWVVSLFVVPFMLRSKKWDGKTTWFGNFKYGRGDTHYKFPATTFWRQWWFLCIRNPVSNFGKQVLDVSDAEWVWLYDQKLIGRLYWKYGWKTPSGEMPTRRTFVYRPWVHKKTTL